MPIVKATEACHNFSSNAKNNKLVDDSKKD
jgi:hypothetical protein